MFKNRKILKRSVELAILWFRSYTSNTRLIEAFDIYIYKELLGKLGRRVKYFKSPRNSKSII